MGKVELNIKPNKTDTEEEIKWTNICDLGLGISQLIPVFVQIACDLDKNKVIFIEEPGIHLHPNYQSKLADLFDCVINSRENKTKNQLKIVIENSFRAIY